MVSSLKTRLLQLVGKRTRLLTSQQITQIAERFAEVTEDNRPGDAWDILQPLRNTQADDRAAAEALLELVRSENLEISRALTLLREITSIETHDNKLLAAAGEALECACDTNALNRPPPADEPVFEQLLTRLQSALASASDPTEQKTLLEGLATTGRMMARQHDALTQRCYERLVELNPENPSAHYGLGLFHKTRGNFQAGMLANQRAAQLVAEETVDAYEWNLGICATGAGASDVALDVWKRMGQKIAAGRFDLPEGSYPQCKVRLAAQPLAERTSETDEPGQEETIWIERLSPAHGIIRSVLYYDLGVDYGDVVLIDGAPITYHTYGDQQIPVFPHLATLVRSNYQLFNFAGTQQQAHQLGDVSEHLGHDAMIYSHTENFRQICQSCWNNPDIDHAEHDQAEKHVVTGQIAAPPDMPASELLSQIDTALAKMPDCKIYAPGLLAAAGQTERIAFTQRRFELLW